MISAGEFLERFRAKNWVLDIMMLGYGGLVVQVVMWFENLPDPSVQQSALVGVVTGMLPFLTNVYAQLRSPNMAGYQEPR